MPKGEPMITKEIAKKFASEWEHAWNSHDIDKIMDHYDNDIVLVSPIAGKLLGDPLVKGYESVRTYFMKGLQTYPDLKFDVLDVLYGEKSIVIYYVNQSGTKAGEFMQLNSDHKIVKMYAHYNQ